MDPVVVDFVVDQLLGGGTCVCCSSQNVGSDGEVKPLK
jgi:hypothetical protein